ncbi:MAG: copper resistance protein NlpE N-terminal domain-containing protein [Flavobacteriales bacterium]|nr:copper resistance protein NlpE N-terminal domain-containing protein [Flavobacteriales bacterium]
MYLFFSCTNRNNSSKDKFHQSSIKKDTLVTHDSLDTDSLIPTADNSRLALDWAGTYRGILPCTDCKGIKTELTLDPSGTYQLKTLHLGKKKTTPLVREGKFEWDKTGNKIQLKDIAEEEGVRHFQVGEEKVFLLDAQGKRVKGTNEQESVLLKYYPDDEIVNKYWKLIEVMNQKISLQTPYPYMIFTSKEVSGNGGCNSFSGSVKITPTNHSIAFLPIAATKMACSDNYRMEIESKFMDALAQSTRYSIQHDTLTLASTRSSSLARFVFDYFKE